MNIEHLPVEEIEHISGVNVTKPVMQVWLPTRSPDSTIATESASTVTAGSAKLTEEIIVSTPLKPTPPTVEPKHTNSYVGVVLPPPVSYLS